MRQLAPVHPPRRDHRSRPPGRLHHCCRPDASQI